MKPLKVYIKQGAPNYKEKRLVKAIEKAIAEKMDKDSNFASTFVPAKDYQQLQKLHTELCTESVEFTEVKSDKSVEEQHKEFRDSSLESAEPKVEDNAPETQGSSTSPFNEANPIVRDYVKDNGFKEDGKDEEQKTTFDEPTSHEQSFEMPSSEDEKGKTKPPPKEKAPKSTGGNKAEPINPKFNEMDNGKKKRSTKKFAKLIVDGTLLLAEKGCIWWTTKEITDDKLIEYELNNTMDLHILLTLENNQKQPVIDWFKSKVKESETLFKVDPQDRDDLVDSLYEVMLEKGIAPTPMQELIINAVKTLILDMGVKAFQFGQQINSVLNQLKVMHVGETASQGGGGDTSDDSQSENPAEKQDNPSTEALQITE